MRTRRPLGLGLTAAALVLTAGSCRPAAEPATVVAAAMSLRHALMELGEAYHDREPGASVRFHFAASGILLEQARQGAPFDVIALAGAEEMDRLAGRDPGVARTRVVFARNRLLVAVPEDGAAPGRLEDLAGPTYRRIALGAPSIVPVGRYARQALESAGLWGALQARLIFAQHARQVVEYLERGEVDAGFVYASDAEEVPWLRVPLEVDPSLHDPILYEAAVLGDALDPGGGRRFLDLLTGNLGQVVLRRHAFAPAGDAGT